MQYLLLVIFIVASIVITVYSLYIRRETVEMFLGEAFTTEGTLPPANTSNVSTFTPTPAPDPSNISKVYSDPAAAAQPNPIVFDQAKLPAMTIPEGSTPEQLSFGKEIIDLYQKVLKRVPSKTEYTNHLGGLIQGTSQVPDVEQQLYNSPEYARIVKVQSNSTNPELLKVVQDLKLIRTIIKYYFDVFQKEPYPSLRLPLKDSYIYLEFKEAAFKKMLQHPNYPKWEADIVSNPLVGRVDVEASIEQYFIRDTLIRAAKQPAPGTSAGTSASQIAANSSNVAQVTQAQQVQQPLVLQKPNVFIIANGGTSAAGNIDINALLAGNTQTLGTARPVAEGDPNMQPMVDSIQKQGFKEKLYFSKRDLVLRPEFSWNMPNRPPPVCTNPPDSKQVEVAPLLEGSKLLLGTSLSDASNTEVGSIMPRFDFKEYTLTDTKPQEVQV